MLNTSFWPSDSRNLMPQSCVGQEASVEKLCCSRCQLPPTCCWLPNTAAVTSARAGSNSLQRENDGPRESRVHISVQIWRSAQQQQPDLVAALEIQDSNIWCSRPVRDAFGPDCGHHLTILQHHYSGLCHIKTSVVWQLLYFTNGIYNQSFNNEQCLV